MLPVASVSFALALLLTPLVRAAARRWGFLDRPNERSSHTRVVPRAGGIAIVLAVSLSLALAPGLWRERPEAVALLAGSLVLAMVGLVDDRFGLSALVRLGIHVATASIFVYAAGPLERVPLPPPLDAALGWLGPAASVVWIVAVVNFYNFMDGIDGLASLQAVVTGVGIALAGLDPFACLVATALAGAAAGFLVFNWSPASVFLGDAGSGALGFALAALPFLATRCPKSTAVGFVALSLWVFLADTTWTLLRRMRRGERLHQAHREHLYQRLVISGARHATVSASLGLGALVLTALGLASLRVENPVRWWLALLAAAVLFAVEAGIVRARERRSAACAG